MNYKKYKKHKKTLHQLDPNFKILRSKSIYINNLKCLMLLNKEKKAAIIRLLSSKQYGIILFDGNIAKEYTFNTDSSTGADTCINLVVSIKDKVRHPLYGKIINRTVKYKAHDEENTCGVGDKVLIMETRPISKDKRWRVVEIIEKAK